MNKVRIFLEMIRFEHTLFALPFAYMGYAFAARSNYRWTEILWVTVAMVSARTAGMCFNRLIDRKIDARNPRTQNRALVTGSFRISWTWMIALISLALLCFSAARLNPLCLQAAPLAVFLLVIYNYLKRWTWGCHFGIGAVLSIAPIGGWMAHSGSIEPAQLALGAAVLFWVAGFDIFYSLQDIEFDRKEGIKSLAARFGESKALQVAAASHFLTLSFLVVAGIMIQISWIYWLGLAVCAGILLLEHHVIRRDGKDKFQFVVFTLNSTLSIFFLIMSTVAIIL